VLLFSEKDGSIVVSAIQSIDENLTRRGTAELETVCIVLFSALPLPGITNGTHKRLE
jgi:hypothetical protein